MKNATLFCGFDALIIAGKEKTHDSSIVDGVVLRDNISQLTHIIGGICGALLGISMR